MNLKHILLTSLLLAAGVAQATALDFTGAGSNSTPIAQTFGDGATWDITYLDVNANNSLLNWSTGYHNTTGVLWASGNDASSWGRITITPTSGNQVTVNTFDLSPYLSNGPSFGTNWAVYAVGGSAAWTPETLTALKTLSPSFTSSAGVVIEWRNSAYNVGIDNINFEVDRKSVV